MIAGAAADSGMLAHECHLSGCLAVASRNPTVTSREDNQVGAAPLSRARGTGCRSRGLRVGIFQRIPLIASPASHTVKKRPRIQRLRPSRDCSGLLVWGDYHACSPSSCGADRGCSRGCLGLLSLLSSPGRGGQLGAGLLSARRSRRRGRTRGCDTAARYVLRSAAGDEHRPLRPVRNGRQGVAP
jgi:hypothetical protein